MAIPFRRPRLTTALRTGIPLLACAAISSGQGTQPLGKDAHGDIAPDASQGIVEGSGKFVPTRQPAGISKTPGTPDEWRDAASQLIERTGGHSFRIGIVQCDTKTRALTIPAQVNAREGLIEYALVTRQGKVHESLLSTEAQPLHIQMAALLLGMSPQPGNRQPCEVIIEVEWATNGPVRKMPLEDLVALAKDTPQNASGDTMTRGPWKFTGSQIDPHGFVAAREGSVISLIEDPAAMIINPRPGREDDSLHIPNAKTMPVSGMPVTVRIRLHRPNTATGDSPAQP